MIKHELTQHETSRRDLLTGIGILGGLAVLTACSKAKTKQQEATPTASFAQETEQTESSLSLPYYNKTDYFKSLSPGRQKRFEEYNLMSVEDFATLNIDRQAELSQMLYLSYKKNIEDYLTGPGYNEFTAPWNREITVTDKNDNPVPVHNEKANTVPVKVMLNQVNFNTSAKMTIAMLMARDAKDNATKWLAEKFLRTLFQKHTKKTYKDYLAELQSITPSMNDTELINTYLPYQLAYITGTPKETGKTGNYSVVCSYSRDGCTNNGYKSCPPRERWYTMEEVHIPVDEKDTTIYHWRIYEDYLKEGHEIDYPIIKNKSLTDE